MSLDIEDSDNLIGFWRERLESYKDWNQLPRDTRKRLIEDLQRCVSALCNVSINKNDLLNLIQLTDTPTVFQAFLSMLALPNLDKMNKYEVLAYLKKVVISSEIARIKKPQNWHQDPPKTPRKGKIADLDYALKYHPFNFRGIRFCKYCDRKLREDNQTGVCTKCQENGRNGNKSEH